MKEYLRQQIENIQDLKLARCIAREYLQARMLEFLQESSAFTNWVFVDGTALRFLYSMPRFSEDLDFSLTRSEEDDRFMKHMERIKSGFKLEDYDVTIKAKIENNVKYAFIKFPGLLYELNLSALPPETLSIKVEIDTNPPDGAKLGTSIIRKHVLLNLQHYDKSSLLAGKCHALLNRKYTKGRDIYDLMWYLSDRSWPEPNIVLLNNSVKQTGWTGPELTLENWREQIAHRLSEFDWDIIIADIKPFVEKYSDLKLLTLENLLKLLNQTK
ncbi:MAG: nucleotidyl transferase AbiEii/AbiGii toxin family protein [bacterium]